MAKAHIKTSNGAEITIEGDSAEVAKIISQVQAASETKTSPRRHSTAVEKKRDVKKQQTASDLIVIMKEDGFFNKPRGLAEVASELQKEGRLFPVTTLSGVMLSLVQKKILSRIKKDGHWVYGKR
jgi:hypothetical protein